MAGQSLKGRKSNNPNGKPKGAKSRKTLEWEMLGEAISTKHAGRFNTVLAKLDDEEFIKAFTNIINYFKPKLASTETKLNLDTTKTDITGIFPEDK